MSLKDLLEELVITFRRASDPFKVRVVEILDELAEKLPEISSEELQLDGEIISILARIVREQELWVKREASIASIGKILALLKIKTMNDKSLARELLDSWHPLVDLQQVTFTEILTALSYLEGREEFKLGEAEALTVEPAALELGIDLEKIIREVEDELESIFKESASIPYGLLVSGRERDEAILRAYALSYLATSGKIVIVYDPLREEYYVEKASSEKGETYSQIVELGRYLNAS